MNGLEIRICLVVNYNLVNKIAKLATLLLKSRVYCNKLQTTPHQLLIFLNFIKNINIYLYTYTNRQTKSHKIVVIVIIYNDSNHYCCVNNRKINYDQRIDNQMGRILVVDARFIIALHN